MRLLGWATWIACSHKADFLSQPNGKEHQIRASASSLVFVESFAPNSNQGPGEGRAGRARDWVRGQGRLSRDGLALAQAPFRTNKYALSEIRQFARCLVPGIT